MECKDLIHIENSFFRSLKNHCNLSRTDVLILISCKEFNNRTYYDFGGTIGVDNSLISRRLLELEGRGYIERRGSKNRKIIRLTEKSEIVFELFEKIAKASHKSCLESGEGGRLCQ